jgi:hypothetical protein
MVKGERVIRELQERYFHPSTSSPHTLNLNPSPDNTKVKGNKFLFPILSDKERNVEASWATSSSRSSTSS